MYTGLKFAGTAMDQRWMSTHGMRLELVIVSPINVRLQLRGEHESCEVALF